MSLRFKLIAIILFVALVPLLVSAITTLRVHQTAFEQKITESHRQTTESAALLAQSYLDAATRTLTLAARAIHWDALSEEERNGALWLLYRQLDDIAVVSLLNEQGQGIGASAYVDAQSVTDDLRNRPLGSSEIFVEFASNIPFAAAKERGLAVGESFAVPNDWPMIATAIEVDGPDAETSWVIAVALSLRSLCGELNKLSIGEMSVELLNTGHHFVCSSDPKLRMTEAPAALRGHTNGEEIRFVDEQGESMLATFTRMPLGWTVFAQQPVRVAFASSRRIRAQTMFWIGVGIVIALAAGLFLAQGIIKPVQRLAEGAKEFSKGNFALRLPVESRDELGRLSDTFNHMGSEIERRDIEIRAWNAELQERVEEQTRELRDAQDQLLQSQKIAAVSSLGAGIAHEINNPLTGVLGLTQILKMKAKKVTNGEGEKQVQMFEKIEGEALRIKEIVKTLLSFSQSYAGEGFSAIGVSELLDETLRLVESQFAAGDIEIVRNYDPALPPVLGNKTDLQQVFLHLYNNSRLAMRKGGKLFVETSSIGGKAVKVVVRDTGKGIAPEDLGRIFEPFFTTKDKEEWEGEGMGLTVAFKIIEQHYGQIRAESELGKGTSMSVTLPAASGGSHLV